MAAESTIRNYILENYLFTDDQSALSSEDSFLEKGILDSTGILEMIYFLEETFGISVADDELVPENMDNLRNIAAYVERRLAKTTDAVV